MTRVGDRAPRREDGRLLRGDGRFVDDVDRPGQLWLRVVRSHVAHGRLRAVDPATALALDGVHAVVIGEDVAYLPPIPVRLQQSEQDLSAYLQPLLAHDRVRYVGEPVAAVLADDAYLAEDAAELVGVDIEPLPAVVDARRACDPGAVSMWGERSNEATTVAVGHGDVEAAFAGAAEVVELELEVGRHTGVPLETRGLVADWDRGRGHLLVWGLTKVAHFNRRVLAGYLGLPESHIVLRSVDAGGGFGVRGEFYPEDFLVPWLAYRLGRPVKWIEDRAEHLVAANHSRAQRHHIAGAFADDGRLLALRDEIWHDTGAYLRTHGVTVPELTANMLPGPYRLPAYAATVHVAMTSKTPAGTYRAPGRYEGTFARERLLDVAAHRLGLDAVELRRRNLLTAAELPHTREFHTLGTPFVLDAGDYGALLEVALETSGYEGWRAEAAAARARGELVGAGVGYFLEKSGLGPYETAVVEVDTSGAVRVLSGGASLGQGIETVLAQIVAGELGVSLDAVEVLHGDTDLVPDGVGSWASRSTVVGGSAALLAARDTAALALRVGAGLLGVGVEDVRLERGAVVAVGRRGAAGASGPRAGDARVVGLGEVAAACYERREANAGSRPGLGARRVFNVDRMTFPYGVHLAQVAVDGGTGGVRIRRYTVAYEVGRAVNPGLVEGQLVGGVAQGLGGALLEEFRYDPDGQPLATTFMDYLLPTAVEMPRVQTIVREDCPAPDNPLGARGAGEGGTTGCGAAVAAAVADALGDPEAVRALPLTPERVRALVTRHGRALDTRSG